MMKVEYPAELQKLADMLDAEGIPYKDDTVISKTPVFTWRNEDMTFSMYRIKYPQRENFTASAIEGYGSYGFERDRIELMMPADNEPVGSYTAAEVFEQIKKDWDSKHE